MVVLDIDPLPVIADREAAARGDAVLFAATASNRAGTLTAVKGDADAAFRAAAYVRRERFTVQRHTAVPMEPRGFVAAWTEERLTLYGAAKVAFTNGAGRSSPCRPGPRSKPSRAIAISQP